MENNQKKKSVKFQGDMLNFYDFIPVFVFTTNHHLKVVRDLHDATMDELRTVGMSTCIIQLDPRRRAVINYERMVCSNRYAKSRYIVKRYCHYDTARHARNFAAAWPRFK